MLKIKISCSFCKKVFYHPSGRVNEAKKFGWRQYCSKQCQNKAKITQIKKICANPNCNKIVVRELNQFKKSKSGKIFCNRSCAASFNNLLRRKTKICLVCGKKFYGARKYCSKFCRFKIPNPKKKSKVEKQKIVLNKIKSFYKEYERIPTKKEKPGLARAAQEIFGTWNNAVTTAGFEPNPVLFAKKHRANDGHICDSFAEKIIDDWFYMKKIKHKRNNPYPENRSLKADFVVNGTIIEFLGLSGVIKRYDQLIKEKRRLCKKHKLSLIEIYPKDLFPINRLSEIFKQ